jgi:hypothetical protein
MKPLGNRCDVGFCRQIQRSQILGAYVGENALQRGGRTGRLIHELAEFGALHGVGTQRIAGVFPLAQQIAPQVPEIRKSWIVHGAPHVGGIASPVFACSACLPVAPRRSVGNSPGRASFLFYRSLD